MLFHLFRLYHSNVHIIGYIIPYKFCFYNVFFFLILSLLLQTAIAVGVELDDNLSPNECMDYYEQDNKLHIKPDSVTNFNTDKDMAEIRLPIIPLTLITGC